MSEESQIIKLHLSKDGKTIVDENGKELAKFSEDIVVHPKEKGAKSKLPGHMECTNECLTYDSNGKCIKYYRSCTWVWDPMDF